MNDNDVFAKTARGAEEIRARSGEVPQRLRSVLILVDGSARVAELRLAAARIGAPADAVEALEHLGLIERKGTASGRSPASGAAASPPPAPRQPKSVEAPPPADAPVARVAPGGAQQFGTAQKFMNDTVVDALGIRAFFFTLKMEKCFTLADLEALLPEYERILVKARGDEVAGALVARLRALLRPPA